MKDYYQTELNNLRRLSQDFAAAHPALAPLLGGQGTDPDVERLLEGTAYLCACVQQRMDSGFPELIQSLIKLTFPRLLLPTPSFSLVQFTSKTGVSDPLPLAEGAQLASNPVDGVSCIYSLTRDTVILPVDVGAVTLETPTASEATITVRCVPSAPLSRWWPNRLRLYMGGDYPQASQRLLTLLTRLTGVTLSTRSGSVRLGAEHVVLPLEIMHKAFASTRNHVLHALLQGYFIFPQQYLFIDITGLDQLRFSPDETALTLTFHLEGNLKELPPFPNDSFALNVAPVVNAFAHMSEPIQLDHTREDYLVRPSDAQARGLSILSVTKVKGFQQGGKARPYKAYEAFSHSQWDGGTYATRTVQATHGKGSEVYLSVLHTEGRPDFTEETLSIELVCTNHALPSRLRVGDICVPTDTSPSMASFRNIVAPSSAFEPLQDETLLWRFLSHLHVNLLALSSAESLQSLIRLYVPDDIASPPRTQSNMKRVDAIESFMTFAEDRLFRGLPIRGRRLALTLDRKGFASAGDMYLFGSVLDIFLASFASINTYTRLEIIDKDSKTHTTWLPRLGEKQLL